MINTTVIDTTTADVNISIAASAAPGPSDVNVLTGTEVPTALMGGFTVKLPPPQLNWISPNSVPSGGMRQFTINGAGFWGKNIKARLARDNWPDIWGSNYSVQDDNNFTCTFDLSNAGQGPWNLYVQADGSDWAFLQNALQITQNPPVLKYVVPNEVTRGVVHLSDVHGYNFDKYAKVRLKKMGSQEIIALNTTALSSEQLTCDVDLRNAALGAWDVIVQNPDGQSSALRGGLTVVENKPVVNAVQPDAGPPGTRVTVTGTAFGPEQGSSTVTIGGVQPTVVSWSDTRIVLVVGEDARSGSVVVATEAGKSNDDHDFTVTEAPRSTWYLAEGSSAWGFSTFVTIENPNPSAVTARVTYMIPAGKGSGKGGSISRTLKLPALSQTTVNPADDLGAPTDFSTRVDCLEGKNIFVDRTMTFDGAGTGPGTHSAVGVTSPARTWCLPEGSSAWGFDCWLLVQNPGSSKANVTLTYMIEGEGPRAVKHTVGAGSRSTFSMKEDIGVHDASIKVTSDQPVIPERSMYTHVKGTLREGSCSTGTTSPAQDYFLAEGSTAWGFKTYVLVQNPNNRANAVTIRALTDGQGCSRPPSRCRQTPGGPSR